MSNFKIGDKVKLLAPEGDNPRFEGGWVEELLKLVGKTRTITKVSPWGFAYLSGTTFVWDLHYLEPVVTKAAPGTYATGKGTTQHILDFLVGRSLGRTAAEIGEALKVPARQLSKRLAEQVKRKTIEVSVEDGLNTYFHATRANDQKIVYDVS